jgi:hypothetical protein
MKTYHPTKMYGGAEVQLHAFLISALDEVEWSASRPGRFTPRERATGTHWIGGWVSLRVGLDAVTKKNKSLPCQESNHSCPTRTLVTILSTPGPISDTDTRNNSILQRT